MIPIQDVKILQTIYTIRNCKIIKGKVIEKHVNEYAKYSDNIYDYISSSYYNGYVVIILDDGARTKLQIDEEYIFENKEDLLKNL